MYSWQVLYENMIFSIEFRCLVKFRLFYYMSETIIPLVNLLMTSGDEDLYIQFFTNINNFAVENEIYFKEYSNLEIITDLEFASISEINNVFNFATQSACFFHFTQQFTEKSKILILVKNTYK